MTIWKYWRQRRLSWIQGLLPATKGNNRMMTQVIELNQNFYFSFWSFRIFENIHQIKERSKFLLLFVYFCLTSSRREYYIFSGALVWVYFQWKFRLFFFFEPLIKNFVNETDSRQINASFIDISRIKWLVFLLLRSSSFCTTRPLASSEATAYYRPAPGRIDSVPERHQRQWI